MNTDNLIGNITTIIKAISMILAGYTVGIAVSLGLKLPVSEAQIADAISIIIFIIIAFFDAKYQNTFFKNNNTNEEPTIKVEVTHDELSDAIAKASEETETTEPEEDSAEGIGDDQQ